jgi:hypothetical protein
MTWKLAIVALIFVAIPSLNGDENLKMRVTPTLATSPAVIRVQVSIEPNDENRSIEIVAESSDYFRSSEMPLDGASASRINSFEYRGLPAGDYTVRGVVKDRNGMARGQSEYQVKVTP